MPSFRIDMNADRNAIDITIDENAPVTVTAPNLTTLIGHLVNFRAAMVQPVAAFPHVSEDAPLSHESGMKWQTEGYTENGSPRVNLLMMHPGIGWIGISLDEEQAKTLSQSIDNVINPTSNPSPNDNTPKDEVKNGRSKRWFFN